MLTSSLPPVLVAIGMPGMPELIVILVIIVIFFGVGKLPAVLSQMGKGVKAFKDGMKEGDDDMAGQLDVTSSTTTASKVTEAEEVKSGG